MENQSTDWLPLLIAVLGILGTLGGVWYGGYRQEKLEDKRWQRERDERSATQNLDDRKAVYSEFLQFLDPWRDVALDIVRQQEPHLNKSDVDRYWEEAQSFMVRILLLAPEEVHAQARRVMYDYLSVFNGAGWEKAGATVEDHLFSTQTRYMGLVQAFREDLGIKSEPQDKPQGKS